MSERNTNGAPTTAADSSIGLAMIVGEMRSEHTHFVEHVEREHVEIRAEFNSRVSEQDTEIADLREALGNMSDVIQSLVDVTEKLALKTQPKTVKIEGDNDDESTAIRVTSLPTRARGEKNSNFHKTLVEFANDEDIDSSPPKPKSMETQAAYNTRVAEWVKDARS